MLPGVLHAPFGADDTDRYIENVIFKRLVKPNEIAAIVVEPIQGEGGYIIPPDGWLRVPARPVHRARHPVRRRRGAVGHGPHRPHVGGRALGRRARHPAVRQGHRQRHAARRDDARADLMTWAIGAHGSTYGGNPVSCAAALATIDLIRGGLADNAAAVGERSCWTGCAPWPPASR